MKQLYTYKCLECGMIFRTDDPEQKVCSDCLKYRQPYHKTRKPNTKPKIPTFAEILHIAEVYNKIHHKYLHYGYIEYLIKLNPKKCVCCGAPVTKNKHICTKCEKYYSGGDVKK